MFNTTYLQQSHNKRCMLYIPSFGSLHISCRISTWFFIHIWQNHIWKIIILHKHKETSLNQAPDGTIWSSPFKKVINLRKFQNTKQKHLHTESFISQNSVSFLMCYTSASFHSFSLHVEKKQSRKLIYFLYFVWVYTVYIL